MSVAFHFAKKGRIVMTDTEIMLKDIGMVYRTNDGIGKGGFLHRHKLSTGRKAPLLKGAGGAYNIIFNKNNIIWKSRLRDSKNAKINPQFLVRNFTINYMYVF